MAKCTAAKKDPLTGRFDIYQTGPKQSAEQERIAERLKNGNQMKRKIQTKPINLRIGEKPKGVRTARALSPDKHNDSVEEHVFVSRGTPRLVLGDKTADVSEKRSVRFRAGMPRAYRNLSGSERAAHHTIFYLSHERRP